jgi:hypothetical protein
MNRVFTKLMVAVLICGLAATAVAKETAPEKPPVPYQGPTRAMEVEPNDSCDTANPLTLDDAMQASISPVADEDYFAFEATAGLCVIFETFPGEGQVGGDTRMWLYADDCATELEFDDDSGDGLYSRFVYTFDADGTYYINIDEFGDNGVIDAYVLLARECPPPPTNDDCSGAIDLQMQGLQEFEVDLCNYVNDYTPAPPECTNDYAANGPDALYKIYLTVGETFSVCENPCSGFIDLAIWLVSDCDDPENTCLVGDDSGNPECVTWTAEYDGWYYLIVDTYSGCGCVVVTVDQPVDTDSESWSTVKGLYR